MSNRMLGPISIVAFIAAACGGNVDGNTSGAGGNGVTGVGGGHAGTTSTGGSTSTGGTNSSGGTGGVAQTGGVPGSGGAPVGGAAGVGGSATGGSAGITGSNEAFKFCDDYSAWCGFGPVGHYASFVECLDTFDSYDASRQGCVTLHLTFAQADGDPNSQHCLHAAGAPPCN